MNLLSHIYGEEFNNEGNIPGISEVIKKLKKQTHVSWKSMCISTINEKSLEVIQKMIV